MHADDGRSGLEEFLTTDPRDAGCGESLRLLPLWVDLVIAGVDVRRALPGVAVHLAVCSPCAVDADGVLAAVTPAS